jgi:hypothetical protein
VSIVVYSSKEVDDTSRIGYTICLIIIVLLTIVFGILI